METNVIYNEECLQGMSERIPDDSIDLIATDPPYNINRDNWDNIDNYLQWSKKWFKTAYNKLSDTGTIYIFSGKEYVTELKLIFDNIFNFQSWIIWERTGMGRYPTWNQSIEFILMGTKSDNYYFKRLKEKSYLEHNYGFSNLDLKEDDTGVYRYRNMTNVWDISSVGRKQKEKTPHKAQKPLKIMKRMIKASSQKEDVVLDPFLGSGTTAVAAKALDRKYIGFEQDEEYYEIAQERVSEVQKELL